MADLVQFSSFRGNMGKAGESKTGEGAGEETDQRVIRTRTGIIAQAVDFPLAMKVPSGPHP